VNDSAFGLKFRKRFENAEGQPLPIQVRRGGQMVSLTGKVSLIPRIESRLAIDEAASPKAVRVREGILKGQVGQ
jgi:hypothetical protein